MLISGLLHIVLFPFKMNRISFTSYPYTNNEGYVCSVLQFPTEELVKEVENSISEFKRHKQEYDEERIREQVRLFYPVKVWACCCHFSFGLLAYS